MRTGLSAGFLQVPAPHYPSPAPVYTRAPPPSSPPLFPSLVNTAFTLAFLPLSGHNLQQRERSTSVICTLAPPTHQQLKPLPQKHLCQGFLPLQSKVPVITISYRWFPFLILLTICNRKRICVMLVSFQVFKGAYVHWSLDECLALWNVFSMFSGGLCSFWTIQELVCVYFAVHGSPMFSLSLFLWAITSQI